MSRRNAHIVLAILVLVLAVGVFDLTVVDGGGERIVALSAVVLSGVAVGWLLSALRRNGNNNGRRDE